MLEALGYSVADAKSPLAPVKFQRREPGDHDVVIDIQYCGVCHSDIHKTRDEWGGSLFPMMPGHEIAGVVTRTGAKVTKHKVGDRVGIGCFLDSCRTCPACQRGIEQFCQKGASFTYGSFEQDKKTPTMGGYSTVITADENFVLRIPENLALNAAAPLLCAGITTYSPLRRWGAGPGKKVAVLGLGGLGHVGVKLAHAMGAEVTVLSHSNKKEADAKRLGADRFYSTADGSVFTALKNEFDMILNTVSQDLDMDAYMSMLKVEGSMILVGLPAKPSLSVKVRTLTHGLRNIAGSMIGGIAETQEMLDFCGKHNIVCDVEMIPIQQVNEAYERVIKSDVRYRFVIDMASLKAA